MAKLTQEHAVVLDLYSKYISMGTQGKMKLRPFESGYSGGKRVENWRDLENHCLRSVALLATFPFSMLTCLCCFFFSFDNIYI